MISKFFGGGNDPADGGDATGGGKVLYGEGSGGRVVNGGDGSGGGKYL